MIESVRAYVDGERLPPDRVVSEADDSAGTIEEGAAFLIEEARQSRLSGEDFGDILCGLNVLCNERLESRQVAQELVGCLRQVKDLKLTQKSTGKIVNPD
jgi:hypothetical protein